MNFLPFALILLAAVGIATAAGSFPPTALWTVGGIAAIAALAGLWQMRSSARTWTKLSQRTDHTQYFQSQLQDTVLCSTIGVCAVSAIDRPRFTGTNTGNALMGWGATGLFNSISRKRHLKGAKDSLARAVPRDEGYVHLVLSSRHLSMWQQIGISDQPPTFLRGIARGSQLADVTTRKGGAWFSGRYVLRLRFVDGSFLDFWAYDLDSATAFDQHAGQAMVH